MFKFLKDKLKSAITKISEGVEKEGRSEEKVIEKTVEEPKPEKSFFAKLKEKIVGREEVQETKIDANGGKKLEKENLPIEKELEIAEGYARDGPNEWPESKLIYSLEKAESLSREQGIDISQRIAEINGLWDSHKTPKPEIKKEIGSAAEQKKYEKHELKINNAEKKEDIKKPIKSEKTEKKHEIKWSKPEHKTGVKNQIKENKKIGPEAGAKEEPKQITGEMQKPAEKEPEKKGFFASLTEKIITTKISEEQFDKLFLDMDMALMENNVAIEVIDKIKNDLKQELVEKPIRRTKVEETISATLKNSISGLFEKGNFDLAQEIKNKAEKPYVIAFFGINGSGKTTSIAKLANMLKEMEISCVLAAADTFRAASIEQLQIHADNIGVNLIKHNYGADPAAVAFDAIKHARAKNIDAVFIDTAGRMHSNINLIDEMKKIIRVAKPDLKIFVGESITGNDCVEQAKTFNEAVGIDGIILAKADIDEKGGAAVSVSYVTKKPILYLGIGQGYNDIEPFQKDKIMKNIGFA